tara:strand:+ start:685 stop:870 length:186 start_codon:yes stop_codon:yes gene_type:complete
MSVSVEPGPRLRYYIVKHYMRADDIRPTTYRVTDDYDIATESMNFLLAQGECAWVEHYKEN